MILSFVDTTGIQNYIFGSNRLRENIGASYLVKQATGAWAKAAALDVSDKTARIVYAGGGNFAVCFNTQTQADAFERELTRKALLEAPGLQLIVAHKEFDFGTHSLAMQVFPAVHKRIDSRKRARPRTDAALGYGVTRACRSTGLAAVGFREEPGSKEKIEASAEVLAKEDVAPCANKELAEEFAILGFHFPQDFDELGRSFEDQSYIAVVHADGNAMSKHLQYIALEYRNPDQNEDYLNALSAFSKAVNEAGSAAMWQTVAQLRGAVSVLPETQVSVISYQERLQIQLAEKGKGSNRREFLPLRPLIYGGDDVTFVCDGRVGITLAALYLKYFEEETNKPDIKAAIGDSLTASAGIAIVKSHHPFARAYALAEELCKSAKKFRKDAAKDKVQIGSCLDWHFGLSGLMPPIEDIRATEYTETAGKLYQRPVARVPVEDARYKYRSWGEVEATTRHFQTDKDWAEQRSKMKQLREVLREGGDAVTKFKTLYEIKAELAPNTPENGWSGDQCTLFDAIELADIYIPVPLP